MDWVEQDGTPGTASWVTTRLTVPMSTRFALRGPGEPVRHPRCERGELQQRERLHGSGQEGVSSIIAGGSHSSARRATPWKHMRHIVLQDSGG